MGVRQAATRTCAGAQTAQYYITNLLNVVVKPNQHHGGGGGLLLPLSVFAEGASGTTDKLQNTTR